MRILVTGAGGAAARNFIESLRMDGFHVYVVGADINEYHLAANMNLDARYLVKPVGHPDYLKELNQIIDAEGIDLLHAQPDVEVEYISEVRDQINSKTFLPSLEAIAICRDKMWTCVYLKKMGVPHPISAHFVDGNEAYQFGLIPGRKKWMRAVKGAGSRAALPVRSLELALEWRRYWREERALESMDFMICEYLPGREFAWQSVWKDGVLWTSMARERKEYLFGNLMPSGQSSSPSIAESLHWEKLNVTGMNAVRAVDEKPNGIYCVDMKENADGVPCVTEINAGRFFTTSNFFSTIGANMPQQYVKMALGEKLDPIPEMHNAAESRKLWIRGVDMKPEVLTHEQVQNRINRII